MAAAAFDSEGYLAYKCCVSCSRRSPFFLAVEDGDANEVARFVREDALWLKHTEKKKKRTAWHIAAEKGHVEVLRVLRDRAREEDAGALLNNQLTLSLSLSSRIVSLSRVQLGPDERVTELVNSRSAWGLPPLALAAANDQAEAVTFLLSIGADPWLGDTDGRTPGHLAAKHGAMRALQVLLEEERTPSSRAVSHNRPNTRYVDALDYFGWSPLHYATWFNRRSAMMMLVGFDANLIVRSLLLHSEYFNLPAGSTPLHVACLHGCLDRVKMLLRAYYETAADLLPSQTALLASVERRRRARSHPDPRLILTRTQRLPFHVAARNGHRHLLDWLDPSVPLMFLFGGEEEDPSGAGAEGAEGAEVRRRSGQVPLVGVSRLTVIAARALHSSLLASLDAAEQEMRRAAEAAEAAAQERRRRRELRRVAKEAAAAAAALKQGKEPPPEGLTGTIRRLMVRASKDDKAAPAPAVAPSATADRDRDSGGGGGGGGWRPWRHRGRRGQRISGGGARISADGGDEHTGAPAPRAHSRSGRRRGTRRRRVAPEPMPAAAVAAANAAATAAAVNAAATAAAAAAAAEAAQRPGSPETADADASVGTAADSAGAVAASAVPLPAADASTGSGAVAVPTTSGPSTNPLGRSSRTLLQQLLPQRRPSDATAAGAVVVTRRSRIWGGGGGGGGDGASASAGGGGGDAAAAAPPAANNDSDTCSSSDGGGGPGLTRIMLRRLYRVALGRRGGTAAAGSCGSRAHGHAALMARLHRAGIQIPEGPDEAVAFFSPGREPRYNMPTQIVLPALAAPRWEPNSAGGGGGGAAAAVTPATSPEPQQPQLPMQQSISPVASGRLDSGDLAAAAEGADASTTAAAEPGQGRGGVNDSARVIHADAGPDAETARRDAAVPDNGGSGGGGGAGGSAFLTQLFSPRDSVDIHSGTGSLSLPMSTTGRPLHLPSLRTSVHMPSPPLHDGMGGGIPQWPMHRPGLPGGPAAASGGAAASAAAAEPPPACSSGASANGPQAEELPSSGTVAAPSSAPPSPTQPAQPASPATAAVGGEQLLPSLPPAPMPAALLTSPAGIAAASEVMFTPTVRDADSEGPLGSSHGDGGGDTEGRHGGLQQQTSSSCVDGGGGGGDRDSSMQLPGTANAAVADAGASSVSPSPRCEGPTGEADGGDDGGRRGGGDGGADAAEQSSRRSSSSNTVSSVTGGAEGLPLLGDHSAAEPAAQTNSAAPELAAAGSVGGASTAEESGWRLSSQLGRMGEGARLLLQSLRNTLRRTSQAQVVPVDSPRSPTAAAGSQIRPGRASSSTQAATAAAAAAPTAAQRSSGRHSNLHPHHSHSGAHASAPRGIRLGNARSHARTTVHLARGSVASPSNYADGDSASGGSRTISGDGGAVAAATATARRRGHRGGVAAAAGGGGGGGQGSGVYGRRSLKAAARRGARGRGRGAGGPEAAAAATGTDAAAAAAAAAAAGGDGTADVGTSPAAGEAEGGGASSDASTGSSRTGGGGGAVDRSGDSEEDVCPVCLEEAPNLLVQTCRHPLCIDCARDLVKRHSLTPALCPYCRGIISSFKPRLVPGAMSPRQG